MRRYRKSPYPPAQKGNSGGGKTGAPVFFPAMSTSSGRMAFLATALVFALLSFFPAAPASCAGPEQSPAIILFGEEEIAEARQGPWNIEAEKLSFDQDREIYEAEGNVRISSGDRIIQADRASLDMRERRAELWGGVSLQYGLNWLKGEHLTWNLDSETGWLDSGVAFFAENNFFVQGKSIAKTGPTQFNLQDGYVTSCNPADPDWKIQYRRMEIDVEGTAWVRGTSLWARSTPVLYLPILAVPVERERQSGFLLPWAGYSNLNGFSIEVPYYWAIRKDMDATLYAEYLEKRGFMGGVEYRVNNRQWGQGIWMFNYLHDQAGKEFLFDQGYPFQTEDRFWFRTRHDVNLPFGFDAKVDLDFVSDKNFLQEFSNGSTSFPHANNVFRNYFGRGILYDETSPVRESSIYLEKRGESQLFSVDLRYWQQLEEPFDDNTIQKLPGLSYSILPTWIGGCPLYYTLQSSVVNYWRQEGDREQRLDVYPRLYMPLHWKNYLDIEPSIGFRTSSYAVQWENSNFDDFNERALTDARLDMSTRLNRVFPVSIGNSVAFEHAIRPEVSYEYATQATHDHLPHLDRLDEDQSRNGVRYGFTTFLTAKEVTTDARGNPVNTYREWARLRAFQFFNMERPFVEDPLFETQVMDTGPSPAGLRLDISPKRFLTLSYDADFDVSSTGEGNSHDLFATLDSGRGHILRVDYQQRPDQEVPIREITTELFVQTLPNLYLNTYHDYSLDQDILFKHGYGFRYFRGCWGIGLAYEREGGDNRVVFSLELLGLGSIGQLNYLGRPQFGEPSPGYQRPESWVLAR